MGERASKREREDRIKSGQSLRKFLRIINTPIGALGRLGKRNEGGVGGEECEK
jgi:hypothetical protein